MRTQSLVLEDKTILHGESFGAETSASGEVVFNTGMVGYPETFTDPSYHGQILVLTYPLIGNYGVADNSKLPPKADQPLVDKTQNLLTYPFESERIQVAGLVVNEYCKAYSHLEASQSLGSWLKSENIPAIEGIDTRALTQRLREKGTMLGKISNVKCQMSKLQLKDQNFDDPNKRNLVAEVSCREPIIYEPPLQNTKHKTQNVLLYDCGVKLNIIRCLLRRGCRVIRVPWDFELTNYELKIKNYDKIRINGIVVSNGPGDPAKCDKTIEQIKNQLVISNSSFIIPILGICLGNQLLALACGAKTYKLKYGHRGQNQPVKMSNVKCQMSNVHSSAFITTQNHGYAVDTDSLPNDWEPWFTNLNDGTNEGIRNKTVDVSAVSPGSFARPN